ncbi:GNAT family N-acetyltransferase [Actinomadura terrae]|uniref:GNAT family N-acetyltransferase n=1 Tax=Actinomadura terrae TaxID=604353 RepID=UPI001FA71669|nr:GNAT family N-acetyltransferase [Actinomadura terrae]
MPNLVPPVVAPGTLAAYAQPVIDAGRGLVLRPWTHRDASVLLAARQDPLIRRWGVRSVESIEEAEEMITALADGWKTETTAGWAVARGEEILGHAGLRTIDLKEGVAECAYWVRPMARGQGIAPVALRALSKWSIGVAGLHRIELYHSVENMPSCQVAAKSGYTLEGTVRSAVLHEDGWHDMHLHALVDE